MKRIRISVLILSLLMLFAVFTACDGKENETETELETVAEPVELTPDELCKAAAEKAASQRYIMSMKMNYNSDNAMMNTVFESMSNMVTSVNVDGNNYAVTMSLMGIDMKYILVDNTVYVDILGEKQKATLTDQQYEEFKNAALGAASADLSVISAYNTVDTVKYEDGSIAIVCKGLSDEANALTDSIVADMEGAGTVNINADTFECDITIDSDGKYKGVTVHMDMALQIDGVGSIQVSCDIEMTYDFVNAQPVTAPVDGDSYTEIPAEDLFGDGEITDGESFGET